MNLKKNILYLIVAVFLAVVIFFIFYFFNQNTKIGNKQSVNVKPLGEGNMIGFPTPENDKDVDGVADDMEEKLGTKNNSNDTDGDGLTDKIEIETYKTDPTKPDTDGDGVMDGVEIVIGQNPLGTGLLKKN